MAIYYLVTLISVLMETAKNVFSNSFSKTSLKNSTDVYKFNTFMYTGSLLVMLVLLCFKGCKLSLYTIVMAFLFAVVSGGMQSTLLRALRHGPLSYVNFIQASGLVIPALFGGLFLNQSVSLIQIVALPILVVSMALVMDLKRGENKGGGMKWIPDAVLSMICLGLVGVVQSMHQASDHADEIYGFLTMTFVFIVVMNFIPWKWNEKKEPANFSVRSKAVLQPAISGVFMGVVNVVNLYLVGVMPTVIFFPIANGGLLIMTMLAAVVFFKEQLNVKQWIGIFIGLVSMCMLGI